MSQAVIPDTTIVARYRDMKKMGQRERLSAAERDVGDGGRTLIAIVLDSVAAFARYDNREEPFRDLKPKQLPEPGDTLTTTLEVAAHMEAAGGVLGLQWIDREIVAARTASLKPTHKEQGVALVRNDLLLRGAAGQPVVGEVKTESDSDGYYALIQLLACAAQLATANQRIRLENAYGLVTGPPIDLVHFVTAHTPAKATYKPDLDQAGHDLAAALTASGALAPYIGAISKAELDVKEGKLLAKRLW